MKLSGPHPPIALSALQAEFLRYIDGSRRMRAGVTFADAQGVQFLCPLCYCANGMRPEGVHLVVCWSRSRGVPDDALPGPGRWALAGTCVDDLTLAAEPGKSRSVALSSPCAWHGFVTDGIATDAGDSNRRKAQMAKQTPPTPTGKPSAAPHAEGGTNAERSTAAEASAATASQPSAAHATATPSSSESPHVRTADSSHAATSVDPAAARTPPLGAATPTTTGQAAPGASASPDAPGLRTAQHGPIGEAEHAQARRRPPDPPCGMPVRYTLGEHERDVNGKRTFPALVIECKSGMAELRALQPNTASPMYLVNVPHKTLRTDQRGHYWQEPEGFDVA